MDLNASPQPEEDEEAFEPSLEEGAAPEHIGHVEHIESAVEILRREREERRQRLKRERPDDRPTRASQPPIFDQMHQKNFRTYDKNKLPPGWLDCPASGQEINCFVPSKVPLGESFNDCVPPGRRYSSKQVIHQQRVLGRKIQCKGRDSVPDNEAVNQFVYEVLQFLFCQKNSKKYVLVHCTHGHNRTGQLNYLLMHALQESINRTILMLLYNFYHERKPEMVVCPPTPEWKRSSDLDLNGDVVPDDDDDGGSAAPLHENHETDAVMTNDDVLGDSVPFDQQNAMRQFCYQALKLGIGVRGNSQFPGSHPVSLNRANLQLLRQRYYYATWKADGTRYMMLITMDGCYLVDRNFNFRRVQMRFPCKSTNDVRINIICFQEAEKTHHFTLLDGEMIIDTLPDSQKQERRYLIYDMMAINQVSLVERPFNERWKMLEKEVIEPRNHERQHIYQSRNPYYRYDLEPFRVRRKDFWLLSTVTKLLKEFIPRLSHEADGLIFQVLYNAMISLRVSEVSDASSNIFSSRKSIFGLRFTFSVSENSSLLEILSSSVFQGWDDPYVPRTHEGLLKWKYAEMNSVDFLFEYHEELRNDRDGFGLSQPTNVLIHICLNIMHTGNNSDPESYSRKIIECSWGSEEDVWKFMRIRTDKATPNDINTYKKVMRSIRDNITEDVLLNEIHEIIRLPMYADRIRTDSKAHHHSNSARRR
ncbi:mRNA capping enzyme family protein [Actinidia rufa]|uniref:mRNA guanylyltransferase n=1 Tax=Actinidia rufa TaxID=165716 RepID=A0A7J0FU63_9ERIC|nr:mRNA capping enzyme family protein [Actinidia rufa]